MKPLGDITYSIPTAAEDDPIYEVPMSCTLHETPSLNEYECPSSVYESNIFSVNVDSSDPTDNSGPDSPSGSVAFRSNAGLNHKESKCFRNEDTLIGNQYENVSAFDIHQNDSKVMLSPRLIKGKFVFPTAVSFPNPPPLPNFPR